MLVVPTSWRSGAPPGAAAPKDGLASSLPRPAPPKLGDRPCLTGLRALAWALVFLAHAGLLAFGRLAEAAMFLFFALSGFLITALLAEEHAATGHVSLRRFFARRGLRLLPALTTFLAVWVIVVTLFGSRHWISSVPGGGSGGHVTVLSALGGSGLALAYVFNWTTLSHVMSSYVPIGHLWSLSVEEQFYLFWAPIVAGVLASRRRSALTALAAVLAAGSFLEVALLWSGTGAGASARLVFGTDVRSGAFLAGGIAALLWRPARARWASRHGARSGEPAGLAFAAWVDRVMLVSLVVLVLAARLTTHVSSTSGEALSWAVASIAAAVTVVCAVVASEGLTARLFDNRLMAYLGRRSYALYLWHYVFLTWFAHAGDLKIPLALAGSLLSAELSWRLVERPALRMKRRFEPACPAVEAGGLDVARRGGPAPASLLRRHAQAAVEADGLPVQVAVLGDGHDQLGELGRIAEPPREEDPGTERPPLLLGQQPEERSVH